MSLRLLFALLACGAPKAPTGVAAPADAAPARAGEAPEATAQITGITYQFMSHLPLEGAVISLAERPALSTISDAQGRFTLSGVPLGEPVTPTVSLEGHVTAHHQRFTLEGDLEPLYLQLVPAQVYGALADGLSAGGLTVDPGACQIVTTVADPRLSEAGDWGAFLEVGDAGLVAGATASIAPPSGARIYFNEQVRPDPSLGATSSDGGVLWLNVSPGAVYTLSAADPSGELTFPDVEVDCQPGRFINASPPWGLTGLR